MSDIDSPRLTLALLNGTMLGIGSHHDVVDGSKTATNKTQPELALETTLMNKQSRRPLALVFLVLAWGNATVHAAPPFPDKNLEAAVRAVLQHDPKTELTDEKLLNVYVLEAPGKDIHDLSGLEKCKNLSLLKLTKNKIADIKALKDLANLQSLDLAENEIVDIGPLAGLAKLQYIELETNKIADIKPLSGLSALSAIYMGENQIADLAPLAGLSHLSSLSLPRNKVSNLAPLEKINKLSLLDLKENEIEDLGPLASQTDLKILILEKNKIKDLSPLLKAAKADAEGPKRFAPYLRLFIGGNPLSDDAKSTQLDDLKKAGVRNEG